MTTQAGTKRQYRKAQGPPFTFAERAIGIGTGVFLGALAGLALGIGLACFGLTMWLWLVLPLAGASIGGAIGCHFPFPLEPSKTEESLSSN